MKVIDFHTHAFPDFLAGRAVQAIEAKAVMQRAYHDGTIAGLLGSMDAAGIEISVLACIATAPEQFESIFKWCGAVRSDRIVPFPSVHPADPDAPGRIRQIAGAGFKGIKLHPLYQDFDVLDPRAVAVYQAVAEAGLILLFHSGDDLGFLGDHRCAPRRMLEIKQQVPSLTMVLAHLGGFWESTEFAQHGLGTDVYIDASLTIPSEPSEQFTRICREHRGRVMFATDSPWTDQTEEVEKLRRAIDDPELREDVLWRNAARLLGLET
jgi:uncharacterized protein